MNLNLKHLRKVCVIAGLLGSSLLFMAPARAVGPLIGPKEHKLPLTESQQDILFGFLAGLCAMSAIEKKKRGQSQQSPQ
jgi:hypothetical protein